MYVYLSENRGREKNGEKNTEGREATERALGLSISRTQTMHG